MTAPIQSERLADTVTWTLSAPPGNEIGSRMLLALEEQLNEVLLMPPKVLIIQSNERVGFCAGADLREFQERLAELQHQDVATQEAAFAELRSFLERIHSVMNRLDHAPFVVIAAVHGAVLGGGFELALTADVLIADKSARFGFPELRLGLIPGFGGLPRLKRDIGNAVARDFLFTGRTFGAERAYQLGIVSQLAAQSKSLDVARRMAEQIVRFDRGAAAQAKAFVKPVLTEELDAEKELFLKMARSPVVFEALSRFVSSKAAMPYLP